MGKLLPSSPPAATATARALSSVPAGGMPLSDGRLPRRFYALGRNALAATEGELALLVAASEDEEVEHAYFTAAVTWRLEAVGFPAKLRAFLDILIEMAAEDTESRRLTDWFDAPDVATGRRARLEPTPPLPPPKPTADSIARYKVALAKWKESHCPTSAETGEVEPREQSKRTVRAWSARERKKLVAWQQVSNVTLVQVEEGDFNLLTRKNRATRYRLLFLDDVSEILKQAKGSRMWRERPLEAIREAAYAKRDAPNASSLRARRRRGRKSSARERLAHRRKAIVTMFKNCGEDLRRLAQEEGETASEQAWVEDVIREARAAFEGDLFNLSDEG